jgi:predicted RNA-binding Zn-ribbon protein involved in translation (DUF1610 family)
MKETKTCPKCNSQDILRIPGQTGAYGSGNNIPVKRTIFSFIPVTRYVCTQCGFSEEWIDSPEDLKKLEQKYPYVQPPIEL